MPDATGRSMTINSLLFLGIRSEETPASRKAKAAGTDGMASKLSDLHFPLVFLATWAIPIPKVYRARLKGGPQVA